MVKPSSFSSLTISGQQDDRRKATKVHSSILNVMSIVTHAATPEVVGRGELTIFFWTIFLLCNLLGIGIIKTI